jgi:hypothetical protein
MNHYAVINHRCPMIVSLARNAPPPRCACDGYHIQLVTMLVEVVNPIALFPAISLTVLRIDWACED